MKRFLIATFILLTTATATAQDWKETLQKFATSVVDEATDGKLTQYALAGTWSYTGPGVKFEGEDLASGLGGAALESTVEQQLEKAYSLAGIRPGAGSFTFGKEDDSFSASLGGHELTGTYSFDAETHVVTLRFAKGKLNLGEFEGHASISGKELLLVFPVTKLVNLVSELGSKVSSLATVSSLLEKYENVYLGFAFSK